MQKTKFLQVDIVNDAHCRALISLLKKNFKEVKGMGEAMIKKLQPLIISGSRKFKIYFIFSIWCGNEYIPFANCNPHYSIWPDPFLNNIYSFIVYSEFRKLRIISCYYRK